MKQGDFFAVARAEDRKRLRCQRNFGQKKDDVAPRFENAVDKRKHNARLAASRDSFEQSRFGLARFVKLGKCGERRRLLVAENQLAFDRRRFGVRVDEDKIAVDRSLFLRNESFFEKRGKMGGRDISVLAQLE
jgi:hypothetical protein